MFKGISFAKLKTQAFNLTTVNSSTKDRHITKES